MNPQSEQTKKQLRWFNISFIAFTSVWGLGNVVNNYAQQGVSVIVSWLLILALYFIPYALIVGQLGSTFKDSAGGVSSWVEHTTTKQLAYLAAWTYWVVHIPYLAQKPQGILVALSWAVNGNGDMVKETPALLLSLICFAIFLLFLWIASKGIKTINAISSIAGIAMFIMSMLFILLAVSAPMVFDIKAATPNLADIKTYLPKFDLQYFTTLSMLVFAVGGAEKISPYVNSTKNPEKEFPKGMIFLAIMVAVSALLGSFAMAFIFNSNDIPKDLMMNGAYEAFAKLGHYYHIGNSLMIIYAVTNTLAQIAALSISIDAPLKILLANANPEYIPSALRKQNKRGTFVNGYLMTGILVGILILVPALGIGDMTELYNLLLNLNSVVMPMRYLFVFLAFIFLMKNIQKFQSEYQFMKKKVPGMIVGIWCFGFTAFACILGMVPKVSYAAEPTQWWFQLLMNIATPLILLALGLILPFIARRENRKK